MHLSIRFVLILFLLGPIGCAPYLVVSGGVVNRDKLEEIRTGVAALRGLDFKAEVPIEVQGKSEMRRYLEKEIEAEYGDTKLRNLSLAYAQLGLIPEGLDLKKLILDFYAAQVAAFYDPRAKKLVLPEDLGGGLFIGALQFLARRDILGEMVLAHELTHALQDQHFSLSERLGPGGNDDKTLALRAVAEGDATLSGFAYLFGGLDEKLLKQIERSVQESIGKARAELADIPEAILEQLLFQYYGGVSFVSRWLDQRGWLGVNFLYVAPPLSTEQVLHPEKYLPSPDPPTAVDIKNPSVIFPPGWEEIENNVLGELMVRVLFKQFFSEEDAKIVADGWDGDRFIAFRRRDERDKIDEIAFLWASVWDSTRDAEEFFHKYQELLVKKYGESVGLRATVQRRDRVVLVVEGKEKNIHLKENIEKIWQGLELKEEPFKPPFPPLKTHRAAILPGIGAAHESAVLRMDEDSLPGPEVGGARDLMAFLPQLRPDLRWNRLLESDLHSLEVIGPGRVESFLKAHSEVNDIGQDLDLPLGLHVASGSAEDKERPFASENHRRHNGMAGSLAGPDAVGMRGVQGEELSAIL